MVRPVSSMVKQKRPGQSVGNSDGENYFEEDFDEESESESDAEHLHMDVEGLIAPSNIGKMGTIVGSFMRRMALAPEVITDH